MAGGEAFVAGIRFIVNSPWEISVSENFAPFFTRGTSDEMRNTAEKVRIEIHTAGSVQDIASEFLADGCTDKDAAVYIGDRFRVYKTAHGGYARLYTDKKCGGAPYAASVFYPDRELVEIAALSGARDYFFESHNLFAHVGLEELFLHFGRIMLHSSYVKYGGRALLFSGVSGAGKSTQADIWKNRMGAEIINGDRAVICADGGEDGGYIAYGSPVAGSSGIFKYGGERAAALILPEKFDSCSIERLHGAAALSAVYANATVNSWDKNSVSASLDILSDFCLRVPVYRLKCTPDEVAAQTVYKELFAK